MNPTNNKPLETELVSASFDRAYKTVMSMGKRIEQRQDAADAAIAALASDTGELTNLTTEDKTDLVSAINEVDSHADENAEAISAEVSRAEGVEGDLSTLVTTEKSSLVGAINEVQNELERAEDALATKVDKTTKVNGHALDEDVILDKDDIGLGNVANVGSSATPVEDGEDNFTTGGAYTELAKKADDNAVVKLTGDQTVAGKKTFSTLPCLPGLTTGTQVQTTALVGFDEHGNLIPALGGGGGSELPASADYVKTNAQGEPQKGTADTEPTENSTALIQSGAVYTALGTKVNLTDIAEAFDSTALTKEGSYVSYNGKLYRCISEHTGAWDANDFDEVILTDELVTLQEFAAQKQDKSVTAPEFDASESYAVGDYVIYQDNLYICSVAHTGAWDVGDFVPTTISEKLKELAPLLKMYDLVVYDQATFDAMAANQDNLQGKTVALLSGTYTLSIDGTRYTDNTAGTSRTFRAIQGVNFVGFGKPIINITNVSLSIPDGFTGASVYALAGSYSGVVINYTVDFSGTVTTFRALSLTSGYVIKDCEVNMTAAGLSLGALSLTVAVIAGTAGSILNTSASLTYDCRDDLTGASTSLTCYSIGRDSVLEGCISRITPTNRGSFQNNVAAVEYGYSGTSALRYGRIRNCRAGGIGNIIYLAKTASYYGFQGCLNMTGCSVDSKASSDATHDAYDTDTSGSTYCCASHTRQATYVVADTPEGGFNS